MTNIRIVVEDNKQIEYEYKGEKKHYIEINSADYGFNQITSFSKNQIYEWAKKNKISLIVWEELEDILDDFDSV